MPTELYEEKPKVSYGKRRPRNRRPYLLPRKLKCDPSKEINLDLVDKYMAGESPLAISIMKAFVRLPDEEWSKFRDMIDRIKNEGQL